MPGMKRDCGGAAGILGAFQAAVKLVSNYYYYFASLLFLWVHGGYISACFMAGFYLEGGWRGSFPPNHPSFPPNLYVMYMYL